MKKVHKARGLTKKKEREIANVLFGICLDEEYKPSDRISAAKLLLDMEAKRTKIDDEDSDIVHVVFEGDVPNYIKTMTD